MAFSFSDGFDSYGYTQTLPKLSWWRRLLRLKHPAGTAYVHFHFRHGEKGWQTVEATAEYPKGMDAVKLTFQVRVDGEPVYFDVPITLGTFPKTS